MTLAKWYEPYGTVLTSTGSATSIFGYAGEQFDTTGLIYLRARYLQPRLGIFLSRDPWSGDVMQPGSMNGFNYGLGNPVNRTDPSGQSVNICVWPNHWEEVYDWSEGRRELVGVRCVGPSGLPPVFGTTITGPSTNPAEIIAKILITFGSICLNEVIQQQHIEVQTKPLPWVVAVPVAQPTQQPAPIPFPTAWPQPTETPEPKHLHVSLGRGEWLGMFTFYLNRKLNPQNIFVYDFLSWKDVGLSDEEARAINLEWTFPQATSRAEHIHFNLEGIDEPNRYAQEWGNQGKFPGPFGISRITAIELYRVKHSPGLCAKTSFYEKGSINQTPSALKWIEVCGGS